MTRYDVVKRAMDLGLGVPALIASLPVQALVAAAVRVKLGSPVLFRQPRPGLHGEVFELVKFRTMLNPDPDRGLVTDADRLTPFGALLRSTSLDELPSLWNVLRGDMSLVGPRPLLVSYLERYTPEQSRRHDVRPGLTGLAQVSGRNAIEWSRKLELDVKYVESKSLMLDLKIMGRTVLNVGRKSHVIPPSELSEPYFRGTENAHSLDGT